MKTHQKTHETASLKPKTLLKATLLQGFSGVFREYRMEILARNGSILRENLDKKKNRSFVFDAINISQNKMSFFKILNSNTKIRF